MQKFAAISPSTENLYHIPVNLQTSPTTVTTYTCIGIYIMYML